MGITKNLGGDRVGSGAKMDVHLHAFESSTHDVTKITRTSQAVGTLVPIYKQLLLKDNKLELDVNASAFTHPTVGPAFAKYKLQIDVYTAPLRLYIGKLHMNMLEQGTKMAEIKLPQIEMKADPIDWTKDPNNQQVGTSCIHTYLGTRGLGDRIVPEQTEVTRMINGVPYLMYVDIYGNYYANQQEGVGYVIHNKNLAETVVDIFAQAPSQADTLLNQYPSTSQIEVIEGSELKIYYDPTPPDPNNIYIARINSIGAGAPSIVAGLAWNSQTLGSDSGGEYLLLQDVEQSLLGYQLTSWRYANPKTEIMPTLESFPLTNINEMRMDILAAVKQVEPFTITEESIEPYGLSLGKTGDVWFKTTSQEGLLLKTYQSDIFNNWLDTTAIESINARSRVQMDMDGGFTMESFLLQEKLFQYLNRIQLAGNTVDDWEEAAYGTKSDRPTEKPIYEGGASYEIEFDEVISTTQTDTQPLGTLAGRGRMGNKRHGGKISIKVKEASYCMVIASITPLLDYYQGNDWDGDLETYEDLHKPSFDKIGFQNLPTDWMASWDSRINEFAGVSYRSVGKQPSWIHYQTNYNQVYGNFADKLQEGWMVNTRDYEPNTITKSIKDVTTYIDPAKWNDIFAYKARDAQNYWMQYYIGAKVRRTMSANQIPGM